MILKIPYPEKKFLISNINFLKNLDNSKAINKKKFYFR